MTESIFTIAAGTDDGRCSAADGSFYDNNNTYVELGHGSGIRAQSWFRFDNVTIPSGATIDSCVLRVICYQTNAVSGAKALMHFEDADDPTYPTSGSDVIGRSLTSGTNWDIPTFTAGNSYDSVDFASHLQTIIDRPGWNSGQAVIVNVVDNAGTGGAYRYAAAYEHSTYDPPKLVVNWSVPYNIGLDDDITITESISLESDLVRQENITIEENVDLLLGFGEVLPTFSENINLSESFNLSLSVSDIPDKYELINLTEYTSIALGFNVDVYESITISDTGNIRPEPFALDSIQISESVTTRRGYDVDVDDNFTVLDTFVIFNYSDWLRKYAFTGKQRFYFVLTGSADNTDDVTIPISSIYAKKVSGDPSYIQVTIPSFNYSVDVALRPNGTMQIYLAYEVNGEIALREQILEADLKNITTYEGPKNRSMLLSGDKIVNYGNNLITFDRQNVIYRSLANSGLTFRFAFIDPFVNAGDTILINDARNIDTVESFTCNKIIYQIYHDRALMELSEIV